MALIAEFEAEHWLLPERIKSTLSSYWERRASAFEYLLKDLKALRIKIYDDPNATNEAYRDWLIGKDVKVYIHEFGKRWGDVYDFEKREIAAIYPNSV